MARPWLLRFSVQLGIAATLAVGVSGVLILRAPPARETRTTMDGNLEESVRSLHEILIRKGRARSAQLFVAECPADPPSLNCLRHALRTALDLDRGPEALRMADALESRSDPAQGRGMRAEALVRSNRQSEALVLLDAMGAEAEGDPFAQYALAHIAYFSERYPPAKAHLERATALGRGAAAHILRTLVAFQESEFGVARQESERALLLEPENADALYNLAVVSQRENQYHAAREGYLRVLRLDPLHADSRYNLALLTHEAHASAEAQHNLEKLREIVGSEDPRVQALDRLFRPAEPLSQPGSAAARSPVRREGP